MLLAQAHNDLRHVRQLLQREQNELSTIITNPIERDLVLHQLTFASRLWYGFLYETWLIIANYWHGLRLEKNTEKQSPNARAKWVATGKDGLEKTIELNEEDKKAADDVRAYFTDRDNLANTIRNKFAFHYDAQKIRSENERLRPDAAHCFVTGRLSGNLFYNFAETVRNSAIIKAGGLTEDGTSFYGQVMRPYAIIDNFTRASIPAVLKKCDPRARTVFSRRLTDLSKARAIVFVDETAMETQVAKQRERTKRA